MVGWFGPVGRCRSRGVVDGGGVGALNSSVLRWRVVSTRATGGGVGTAGVGSGDEAEVFDACERGDELGGPWPAAREPEVGLSCGVGELSGGVE